MQKSQEAGKFKLQSDLWDALKKFHSVINLYSSPDIVRMMNSRRVRWEEHLACMGEMRNPHKMLGRIPERKMPVGRPTTDGRIILQWIIKKWGQSVDWIHLTQNGDQWHDPVNIIIVLCIP
jgi:hypothetical protein